jgi:hypothetical protein
LDALELLLNEKRLNAVIAMPTVQNPLGLHHAAGGEKTPGAADERSSGAAN